MIIILVMSFFLEGILSLLINQNSILLPLFSIMSIFIIYPYVKDKKTYVLYILIMGFLYDTIYNQTLFLYTIIFLFIGILIILFNKYLPINFFNTFLETIIIIIIFRILGYFAYTISINGTFSVSKLFESIYKSIVLNIIYVYTLSHIIRKHFNKLKIGYKIN